jgi:hypothetical protein
MKVSIIIAICLSLFTASVAVFGSGSRAAAVHVISSKQKDQFVFKVNKSWHGARVELIAPNGDIVSRQRLLKRKMIIDFGDMKPGTYRVTVTKNHHTEEFQFIKK